ncbi:unnamed protein product (mitochondrion) [Plasmodiophora brassicae]|uniref:Uncharacterized protein n=1 Tax=Plasmodiophora brassicae TaxID=37360 RepID=A0A0G4J3J4_PLABS|nr:hypothetical protein PBRA_008783 [Plasmodiophora brassicae]SPR01670.1 unnamed protein product [Plasmodiophora brassicae]
MLLTPSPNNCACKDRERGSEIMTAPVPVNVPGAQIMINHALTGYDRPFIPDDHDSPAHPLPGREVCRPATDIGTATPGRCGLHRHGHCADPAVLQNLRAASSTRRSAGTSFSQTATDCRRAHGAMLQAVIIVAAAVLLHLGAVIESATLRSNDGVDYAVDTGRVADHCLGLTHLVTDADDGGAILLSPIPSAHMKVMVAFMNETTANETARASEWIQAMPSPTTTVPVMNATTTALAQESALLTCAHYVGMESLARAIMWPRRTWADVAALRDHLHQNAFWFAVHCCPALDRLRRIANSTAQATLVSHIPDLLVRGANVTDADRPHLDKLLQLSARSGDEVAVDLLLNVPGVDVNAFTMGNVISRNATALHWGVAYNRSDVVRVLLAAPGVDVNARVHPTSWTPLHLAAATGEATIARLLLDDPRVDAGATDAYGWTAADIATRTGHPEIVSLIDEYRWGALAQAAARLFTVFCGGIVDFVNV